MTASCPHCGKSLPVKRKVLTDGERALFDLVAARAQRRLAPETYEVMRGQLGLSSKSMVAKLVDSLEAKGWITRERGKHHSIEIVGQGA